MAASSPRDPNYPLESEIIQFIGTPTARGTASGKDQRIVNAYVELLENPLTKKAKARLVKRNGQAAFSQPPAGAATGRGIYYWAGTDKIYSVFANKIYSNTTDLGVTLSGSTGRVWFDESPSTFGEGQRLFVSDGTKLYSINTSDVVTTIDTVSDAQFPSPNLGPVIWFDSYVFLFTSTGIWNSDVDTATSWNSASFVSTEQFGDALESALRQKDQIITLGTFSVETYYDNQNATGSPLQRIAQNTIQVGTITRNSMAVEGDIGLWVAKNRREEYSIWLIDGITSIGRVSTPPIEKILAGEGSNMTSCTSFLIRSGGHIFYFLNLAGANRTLVYDVTTNHWTEAEAAGGGKFNCVAATEKAGVIYLQDASNGRIYTYSPTTYQDNGSNYTVTIQTDRYDHGTALCKFCTGIRILGDLTTGNLSVSYSNDDYATFTTARNIDLSQQRRYLPALGRYFERAWKMTYADNYALRLDGFEEEFIRGTV